MEQSDFARESVLASLRVAPPAFVSVATALKALDPQWVIAIPTVLFITMQAAYLFWKWRREASKK